ncbi:putative phage abortive infection protein [Brenneria sp. g21c3]|uniref:putative phage abortive infection protein n=1 Tax=Brenneria sp. g21c3 TaxID=3093893 RepID=UPI002EC2CA37|nr:putative phage abortive infection protein [Brenneria sp. g21c3]
MFKFFISEKFSRILIFLGFLLFLGFVFSFGYKAILFNFDIPIKTDVFGQLGDVIGGITGSLWALAGVILFYAGLMEQRKDIITNKEALQKQINALENQREEIKLQREEYAMARKIYEEQRDVLKEQSRTSRIQQFESNFYSLIEIYTRIRNDILLSKDNIMKEINENIIITGEISKDIKKNVEIISRKYSSFYYINKDKISHYLKTIYRLYKVIDEQDDLDEKKKYFYSKIIRSQLIDEELYLIYYNSRSEYGKNFRRLILKYNILKHLTLTSKAEFVFFNCENNETNIDRSILINWLDDFMIRNHQDMTDISMDDPVRVEKYSHEGDRLLLSLSLTDEGNYLFNVEITDSEFIKKIGFSDLKEFNFFIEYYIYDRFILSNLESIGCDDCIFINMINESRCEYILKTDKNFKVNFDKY